MKIFITDPESIPILQSVEFTVSDKELIAIKNTLLKNDFIKEAFIIIK